LANIVAILPYTLLLDVPGQAMECCILHVGNQLCASTEFLDHRYVFRRCQADAHALHLFYEPDVLVGRVDLLEEWYTCFVEI
jgi:hypothetical protein